MRDAPELAVVNRGETRCLAVARARFETVSASQCRVCQLSSDIRPLSYRLNPFLSHSPRRIGGDAHGNLAAEPANPIVRESCCLVPLVAPPSADWRASETGADLKASGLWR